MDPRLYGTFVEHMGRSVYTGIYEPSHPTADADGFRSDVADLVRELGPTAARYPGGNFVSGYRWEDGIGPVAERPRRLDLAWRRVETNEVGVDEFARWAERVGLEPILAVNLGTRGVQEAVDLLEYCNHPGGTELSDLRRANGTKEPHDVRTWCLGNELDGPWQVGHKTAHEYGRLAAETARAMRMVDPRIELVACGSSNSAMPTFGAWEATMLEECYDLVDYVSLHTYYDPHVTDRASFLASSLDLEHMIRTVVATADHVGARVRSQRRLRLSVDEWNVWHQSRFAGQDGLAYDDEDPALIEDVYDVTDAVVVGSLLITLLRHCDRVGIACQAQLVNVIAPIMTRADGGAWRQTIFHPFAQASRYARGEVLRVEPRVRRHSTADHDDVPVLDAVATWDEQAGALTVLCVNRDQQEQVRFEADARSFTGLRLLEATVLTADDPTTTNTEAAPDAVRPRPLEGVEVQDGRISAVLPAVSWAVLRFTAAGPASSPHQS
ncbi:alpha-N-arabinofuranosidase [Nocardioides panacis]|uniref:arabinosylfuranosidase ArfA n=1 Tax=Nocardioides panacis TaxID=2849501 RepID=UPI00345E5EF4